VSFRVSSAAGSDRTAADVDSVSEVARSERFELVVHRSDFDVLIPSHSRIGKFSGGKRISMLRETPG
jgi:hypothetical protein